MPFWYHRSSAPTNSHLQKLTDWTENRFAYYAKGPEVPGDNPESAEAAPDKGPEKADATKQMQDDLRKQYEDAVGEAMKDAQNGGAEKKPSPYKPLPKLEAGKVAKAAAITTGVVVPPVGLAMGAGYLGWKGLRRIPPFGWLEKKVAGGMQLAREGVGTVANVASYPFRLTGTLLSNITKLSMRLGYNVLDSTLFEFYRDIKFAINEKVGTPKGTNLLATAAVGTKKALLAAFQYPFRILDSLADNISAHPLKSTIGAILAYAAVTNMGAVTTGLGQLFTTLATRLGGAPI